MDQHTSQELFERAQRVIPGGVNSPVRAFKQVGGTPPFIRSADGAYLVDEDGNRFLDFVGSWGPMILGHAHPVVMEAAREACLRGSSYGAPTRAEVELAEALCQRFPAVEMVRLVSSGTEAVMSALRLARAATGRDRVVKFEGCYHGHSDGLLARAGSGLATLGIPDVPGIPASVAANTLTLPYNDTGAVEELMARVGDTVAAIIVEPVAGNMGVVPPAAGFLQNLRDVTTRHGALLVFDEVITGCRVAAGGAQERFSLTPDLTILGKIIGGGFPLAAYGGRRDLMAQISPSGPVYQAGTLSGNPVATAAGLATLSNLDADAYAALEAMGAHFQRTLAGAAQAAGVPVSIQRVGSMLTVFFSSTTPTNFADVQQTGARRYAALHRGLLERGVYFPPSAFETMFVSTAHTTEELDNAAAAFGAALAEG